jgi:ABC-2 type transport system ATP-binding protein
MNNDVVIKVSGVSKTFKLPHEKNTSVKSALINSLRNKRSFEKQQALKDISFEIKKGEFFGIVGRNGSGKSTLLKIIAGIYQPSEGNLEVKGKLVPFIELGVGFNPELTGRENVYLNGALLGFSEKEVRNMYQDIVKFAELEKFMDQKLKNYSSGMQVRLAFSMAIRAEADILLIDEVLAVGDADFQRKCFDYFRSLKKNKKTVVFVSHDMTAVREYCDKAVLIENSELVIEDSANKVATAYTKMFIDQSAGADAGKQPSKKWGDERVVYEKINLSHNKLTDKDNILKIEVEASVKQDVDHPNFGFSIKSASGVQLLGTNTQIKKQDIPKLKAGDSIAITWSVPNIFNEGKHYVDAAIIHHDGTAVAQWWEEAARFNVVREEKTPYPTAPTINLDIKLNEPDK